MDSPILLPPKKYGLCRTEITQVLGITAMTGALNLPGWERISAAKESKNAFELADERNQRQKGELKQEQAGKKSYQPGNLDKGKKDQ